MWMPETKWEPSTILKMAALNIYKHTFVKEPNIHNLTKVLFSYANTFYLAHNFQWYMVFWNFVAPLNAFEMLGFLNVVKEIKDLKS